MKSRFVEIPFTDSHMKIGPAVREAAYVYDHFANYPNMAEHLIYLSNAIRLGIIALFAAKAQDYGMEGLKEFDYIINPPTNALTHPRLFVEQFPGKFEKLLTERAFIAAGMIHVEFSGNGEMAWLEEPFADVTILPGLYKKYKMNRLT